jgi:hypothetical protein
MRSYRCAALFLFAAFVACSAARSGQSALYVAPANAERALVPNVTPSTRTFVYTGAQQNFVVPTGVTELAVAAYGAPGAGALGGYVQATIPVTPGEMLAIFVGGHGTPSGRHPGLGGFNGGGNAGGSPRGGGHGNGGGGASDVRQGGNGLANRVVVAGGGGGNGGGGCSTPGLGGAGGFPGGHNGSDGGEDCEGPSGGGGGGLGGTQTAGGAGGQGGYAACSGGGESGSNGALGVGGSGGVGGGSLSCAGPGGGGAGGGYYGGGGGGGGADGDGAGGGGGGSSYVEPDATNVTSVPGTTVTGSITLSWPPAVRER